MSSINSLLSQLKINQKNGASQSSNMHKLHEIIGGLGLVLSHDEYSVDSDNIVTANKEINEDSPAFKVEDGKLVEYHSDQSLMEHTTPITGEYGYLDEQNSYIKRVIISRNRHNKYNENPLCVECNGIVIDAENWDVLSMPSRAFSDATVEEVNINLDEDNYEFIKVIDGTVITLYNWDYDDKNIWCMSTSNGYDVSHLKWMGPKTYSELVFSELNKCPGFTEHYGMQLTKDVLCSGDTRLDFSNLDKNKSYTFILRSHYYHPLLIDLEGIWLSHTYDRISKSYTYEMKLVPGQTKFDRKTFKSHIELDPNSSINLSDIEKFNNGSLQYVIDNNDAPENIDYHKINYGFILRSKKPNVNKCYKDVLVESDLLKQVRRLVYRYPTPIIRNTLNSYNRMTYFLMKAFLVPVDQAEFLELFPYYRGKFQAFEVIKDILISHIIFVSLFVTLEHFVVHVH
jgi:hypothetical protein